jgi:uncharacterized iron-regulated protein
MTTCLFRTLFILLVTIIAGCTARHAKINAEMPYPPSRQPVVGEILHMRTGFFVSEAEMLSTVTEANIVYVDEAHNNMASHRLQLKVLKAMADRWPGQVALGMEMFIPEQQGALDRWVAGELSEAEFLEASQWSKRWNIDFGYYRDLLVFAREHGIPVLGLNIPKSLVRAVAKEDFPQLTEEVRSQLPDIDMNTPYRNALTSAIYGGHAKSKNGLKGFQRVQALWDESMAENTVRYLKSAEGQNRRMVIIAGGNHIRYGIGIPRAVYRRLPISYVLVGARVIVIQDEDKGEIMNVEMPEFPMIPYDFISFIEFEKLNKQDNSHDKLTD